MTTTTPDAVDTILGVAPGSPLDELRHRRPVTRDNTQASYVALFHPAALDELTLAERFAIAVFVATLHGDSETAGFYGQGLKQAGSGLEAAVHQAAAAGATLGPYGEYRETGLKGESRPGLRWATPPELREALGPRFAAALDHVHLLVFRPRESSPAALNALVDAGWSTTGIVTLSQLVAFLAYQLRIITGLKLLAALPAAGPTAVHEEAQTVRIGS